jgi:dTDP-L-rhamnose 4-epimerase
MKVLVTGGAGFIGSHTVPLLLNHGHEVIVLDNLDPQIHDSYSTQPYSLASYIKHHHIQFVQSQVEDRATLARLLRDREAVIHLAASVGVGQSAYELRQYTSSNALGTATLMDVLVKEQTPVRTLVVASSISNYGEGRGWNPVRKEYVSPIRALVDLQKGQWEPKDSRDGVIVEPRPTPEDYSLKPCSVYGLTKYFAEQVALLAGCHERLSVLCLRYANVYGPGQSLNNPYTGILAIFYTRLKSGKPLLLFEDGRQTRDFIHVYDVARANVLGIESHVNGSHCFNIGTGHPMSLLEIGTLLRKKMKKDLEPVTLFQARHGDIRHCFLDVALAREKIHFQATISPEQGIEDMVHALDDADVNDTLDEAMKELTHYELITRTNVLDSKALSL